MASKSVSSSDNRIHSNIYSLTLIENGGGNGIKQELDLLKKKLYAL